MRHPLRTWFVATYLLFWFFLAAIGVSMSIGLPAWQLETMKIVSAWAPTFTVLLLFRFLFPGRRLGEVLRERLAVRISIPLVLYAVTLQAALALLALGATQLATGKGLSTLGFKAPSDLLPALPGILLSGAFGEELGWRGYALGALRERHSGLFSGVIVGLLWGFWHLPLWFATGLGGAELAVYIAAFLVAIVSVSIVITVWYGLCPNLLVAGVLHLGFNFWLNFVAVDVNAYLKGLALTYALAASVLAVVNPKRTLRAPPPREH
jgi:hypothetical protein